MAFLNDIMKKLGLGKDEESQEGGDNSGAATGKVYKCSTCGSESKDVAGACCGGERQGV